MTSLERAAVTCLLSCSFPRKCFDSRFVRELFDRDLKRPGDELATDAEDRLWRLAWKYRRQISDQAVLAEAQARVERAKGTPLLSFPHEGVRVGR